MDPTDEPAAPHAGIPDDELSPWQAFDRMAWHRLRMMEVRARVRAYAAKLLAVHGVEHANAALPDVSIGLDGVVRFDDQYQQDEAWRETVSAIHDEVGDALLDRLPPDTRIDIVTGVVTIDDDVQPWW